MDYAGLHFHGILAPPPGFERALDSLGYSTRVKMSMANFTRRMQRAHRCLTGLGFSKDVLVLTRTQVNGYSTSV